MDCISRTDNFSFFDANGLNTITDIDTGAFRGGIAITSLSSGNGTWQYRLNNSGDWLAMGSAQQFTAATLTSELAEFDVQETWRASDGRADVLLMKKK